MMQIIVPRQPEVEQLKKTRASRSRNLVLRFMGGIGPRSSVGRDRKGEVSLRNVDNLQLKMANEE